jgi:hypothetical protein
MTRIKIVDSLVDEVADIEYSALREVRQVVASSCIGSVTSELTEGVASARVCPSLVLAFSSKVLVQ